MRPGEVNTLLHVCASRVIKAQELQDPKESDAYALPRWTLVV